ncbi:MAG: S-layer homology domain-containing protein [Fibrobacteria bacterium]|nr:S-layer homology domain-containing protein [Fibrobacteria bacterium]
MKSRILPLLALVPLVFTACGQKRKAAGLMDDPRTHTERGKQYYDAGELDRADQEFTLALELDKKYAPAIAGQAMVLASRGEFDKAIDRADKAIVKNDKLPDGWMAKGWAITLKNRGAKDEDWVDDAERMFSKALDRDEKSGETWYRLGMCRQWGLKFREAGDAFRKVLEINGSYTEKANEAWARIQKIERSAPGTRVGRKIALVDSITRADAAALFIAELELDRILGRTRGAAVDTTFQAPAVPTVDTVKVVKAAIAKDIEGNWARNFIEDAVGLGIRGLQVYPDRTFHPNEAVRRAEFAFLAEDALIAALGDKTLATKYIGSTSRFSDVAGGSPYYNAICNAVDKNIMDGNADGSFGAMKPVSGADALLTIRLIKELRK